MMYYTVSLPTLRLLVAVLAVELKLTPPRAAGRSTLVRTLAELRAEIRRRERETQPSLF